MRYSKQHKAETRERIIETAAPLFRKNGFSGVSVDKLMNAVGLTRGGFYAHFESKEALIEAILNRNAGLVRMMSERKSGNSKEGNAEALCILQDYLSAENLDEIIAGCPLATMPIDASRSSQRIRGAYGERLRALIAQIQRGLGRGRKKEDDAIAAAVLAVGGVIFARASADSDEARRIAEACSRQVARILRR